jgi:putative ABC transport system permease protein
MSLARLLTFRSMRSRPLRLLLSVFGIVLGVAGILAIGITNQTALEAVTRLFKDTSGKANLVVINADSSASGFSEKAYARLTTYPGLAAAVPSLHVQTILAKDATPTDISLSFFGSSLGGLSLYGINPRIDAQARDYKMVAGGFLSGDPDADEVVLVDSYAKEKDIRVGSYLEILAGDSIQKLRVVGLMAKEGAGQLNNGSFGVIPLQTAQRLFNRQNKLDQIDIVAPSDKTSIAALESLKTGLQTSLGKDFSVIYPAAQGRRMTQMLGNFQIGLNFLSGMALFVGAFLIYNAFSMTVVERTREFGMLRTVGMSRAQVTRQIMSEAAVLGMIGSGLGLGLGILMARGLTRLMEVLLAQDLTAIQVPMDIVVTGVLVGVVTTLLAAALPAFQAGRISPLEALRARAGSRDGWLIRHGWWLGVVLLAASSVILIINPFPYDVQFRLGSMAVFSLFLGGTLMIPVSVSVWERSMRPFMRLIYGSMGRLGSTNIQRAKQRTTLTVAALMVGVSMIIVVWAMTGSFKSDLDEWLKGYIGGDLYVSSSLPMRKDLWNRISAVEGVASVAPVHYFNVQWQPPEGDKVSLSFMAFDPASYSRVTSFVFSKDQTDPHQAMERLAAGEAVFISSVLSEKYGLRTGDSLRLLTKTGEHDFQIAGVVVDYYNQGLTVEGNWIDMERYFRQSEANALLLKVKPGDQPDEVRTRIDALYGKHDRLVIVTNKAILERVSTLVKQAFSMFDVLAIIALMVGFLGITNTLTMNVMERTQEIGMLRGVGMTRFQVVLMILSEAGLMGVIGSVLGLVFGVILSRIFLQAMTTMSGYRLTYLLPVQRVLIALVVAILVANIAAILPAMRAARIRILEAIHYE